MAPVNNTNHQEPNYHQSILPVIRISAVLLLRAGSLLIQLGTYPTQNINNIIYHNLVDIASASFFYIVPGFILAFGSWDYLGLISYGPWSYYHEKKNYELIIYGYCAVLLATNIITMQLSGRMHIAACFCINLIYAGFLLPITMHWVWHEKGFLNHFTLWNYNLHFIDTSGGVVIHGGAASIGLVGSLILGRRLLLLKQIDQSSIGLESPATTILGYFLMIIGLITMLIPPKSTSIDKIMFNGIISMGVAVIIKIFLQLILRNELNYWASLNCIQAGIVGLVVLSTGVTLYNPITCIALSIVTTLSISIIAPLLQSTSLEDYCNITLIHLVASLFGVIPAQIQIHDEIILKTLMITLWQILVTIFILLVNQIVFTLIFVILLLAFCLRNEEEASSHVRSVILNKYYKRPPMKRFFKIQKEQNILEPNTYRMSPFNNRTKIIDYNSGNKHHGLWSYFKTSQSSKRIQSDSPGTSIALNQENMIYKLDDLIDLRKQDECTESSLSSCVAGGSDAYFSKSVEIDSSGFCNNCKTILMNNEIRKFDSD